MDENEEMKDNYERGLLDKEDKMIYEQLIKTDKSKIASWNDVVKTLD